MNRLNCNRVESVSCRIAAGEKNATEFAVPGRNQRVYVVRGKELVFKTFRKIVM